jgi:pyrimidine-nucleoside phosphorylase
LIYALRDVTSTVASIPLIASSIMSKKLACGADNILLDIKVGSGAFMKTLSEARELASLCVKIGKANGRRTVAFLTDMNQPLGRAIGNHIEVQEAVSLLKAETVESRFYNETITLCDAALQIIGSDRSASELIETGEAFRKFEQIIAAQGGNLSNENDTTAHPSELYSASDGYIESIDALKTGLAASMIGAGRLTKSDPPDLQAGIWLNKCQGEYVKKGETIATLFASNSNRITNDTKELLLSAYTFSASKPNQSPHPILERVDN